MQSSEVEKTGVGLGGDVGTTGTLLVGVIGMSVGDGLSVGVGVSVGVGTSGSGVGVGTSVGWVTSLCAATARMNRERTRRKMAVSLSLLKKTAIFRM